jgi:hypothetical protein
MCMGSDDALVMLYYCHLDPHKHTHTQSQNAAAQCLTFFSGYLGRSILQGRIEGHHEGAEWLEDIKKSPFIRGSLF